jgi:hypothetical protein
MLWKKTFLREIPCESFLPKATFSQKDFLAPEAQKAYQNLTLEDADSLLLAPDLF